MTSPNTTQGLQAAADGRRLLVYLDGKLLTDRGHTFVVARDNDGRVHHVYYRGQRLEVEAMGQVRNTTLVRLVSHQR